MSDTTPRITLALLDRMVGAALRNDANAPPPGLRWRIKQIQRQDWPDTLVDDPRIKRGYTPRQVLRMITALTMLDAGLGPTGAVRVARENEATALAVMQSGARSRHADDPPSMPFLALLERSEIASDAGGAGSVLRAVPTARIAQTLSQADRCTALLVIDLALAAERALAAPGVADRIDRDAFDAIMDEGAALTARGLGHVPGDHPGGDRYVSPRRQGSRAVGPVRETARRTEGAPD